MNSVGLGLRSTFVDELLQTLPTLPFLEVHSENYFGNSANRDKLVAVAENYPLFLHGIGASLGSTEPITKKHLHNITSLVAQFQPKAVSEHLAWCSHNHRHSPDLLPLPRNTQSVDAMTANIDRLQQAIGRQLWVENPANYLCFPEDTMSEIDWIHAIVQKSGCGLLLDVNNVYISAQNLGFNAQNYLHQLDKDNVKQYHIGGHSRRTIADKLVLIDSHDNNIATEVLQLYRLCLNLFGDLPCIVERDGNIPSLKALLQETRRCATATVINLEPSPVSKPIGRPSKFTTLSTSLTSWQQRFFDNLLHYDTESQRHFGNNFAIYRNNYIRNILDYLQAVYPATASLIGTDLFEQSCRDFAENTSPQSGNIFEYGEYLTTYLATTTQQLPYINDIAQLEWSLHSCYFTSRCELKLPQQSTDIGLMQMKNPQSLLLLQSQYPLLDIRRTALDTNNSKLQIEQLQYQYFLVCKNAAQHPDCTGIIQRDFLLLQLLKEGDALGTAIAKLTKEFTEQQLATSVTDCINLLQ